MSPADVTDGAVEALHRQIVREAEQGGYRVNPDVPFAKALARGLLVNQARYGYISCPCRLAAGRKEADLDIICPCDYRDPDLNEYGACFCALYVSEDIYKGLKKPQSIPERRPPQGTRADGGTTIMEAPTTMTTTKATGFSLKYPVWRCKVCGYLCARDEPPGQCPVCKVGKERFERFI
ncbi:MAG TPA: ferredoxin-thioredoxin reductase catalytic domain-containing protein [Methanocella sp.]|nr:ferredoxin-thioredoxin reductase catalytic domain-containing protein [Methanocella sp.]